MSDYTLSIQDVNLGEQAREEIDAARAAGIDPMSLARTHQRLGYLIPHLLKQEAADV